MKFLKIVLVVALVLAMAAFIIFQLPQFGGKFEGARLERMRRSPQFIDGKFQNIPPQDTDSSIIKTLRLYRQGQVRKPVREIPVVDIPPAAMQMPAAPGLRAMWFGHSSVLVEIDGVRVMTDPSCRKSSRRCRSSGRSAFTGRRSRSSN